MSWGGIRKFNIPKLAYKATDIIELDLEVDVDLKAQQARIPLYYAPGYLSYVKADPGRHIMDVGITGDEITANRYDDYVARINKVVNINAGLPPKYLKVGGWLQEYYDGRWWNIGCNSPCVTDIVYIAKGDSIVTATPSKSSASPGETINVHVTLTGGYSNVDKVWSVRILLDDGTILRDWTGLMISNWPRNAKFDIPVTVPNKVGQHKVYVIVAHHDYNEYHGDLTDYYLWNLKSAVVSGFTTFDLEIKEAPPQLDPGVYDSQITDAFWEPERTAEKVTLGPGDRKAFYAGIKTGGPAHYYLVVDYPGKQEVIDLGQHSAGDKFYQDGEITAPETEGDYTVTLQLAVLDPADGKVKTIPGATASLPFTVRGGTLDQAKNSTLSVDVPALVLTGKRTNITARVVAAASGYYAVRIYQGDTPIGSVGGPVWIDRGKSTAFVGWLKFDKEGTYDLTFRLEFGTDGQHFYDTGVAKSATVQVVPPVGLVRDWGVSTDKEKAKPGEDVTVTVTVDWQVVSGVQFKVRFDWFGVPLESQPVAPSESPAVIRATLTVPEKPAAEKASATLLVGV